MSGLLSVVGTPIGNLDDLSPRASRTLARAEIIACEDTRVTRKLLTARVPDARGRLVAYHSQNEIARTAELVRAIAAGAHVALATDAGMPGISDPGQRLVAACAEAGLRIEVIPGPSAVAAALVGSGLPSARFTFEGFLPRTPSARRHRLEGLVGDERTLVFFESPHRAAETLQAMAEVFGDRRGALARELTKLHEEIVRGTLSELATRAQTEAPRGEITIVVEGGTPPAVERPDDATLAEDVARRVATGMHTKDAIAAVALESGIAKRDVYRAVVENR